GELGGKRQPAECRVALLGRHLPLLDRAAEEVLDRPAGPLAELLAHLAADGLEPGLRGDLGDPRAHRSQTDYANATNHNAMLTRGRTQASLPSSEHMTRFLLATLAFGLCALAVIGAFTQAARGRRPVLLARRASALP